MPRQEYLQKQRSSRQREDAVSTFPEIRQQKGGGPDDNSREILADITEILTANEQTLHQLGHVGIEAS